MTGSDSASTNPIGRGCADTPIDHTNTAITATARAVTRSMAGSLTFSCSCRITCMLLTHSERRTRRFPSMSPPGAASARAAHAALARLSWRVAAKSGTRESSCTLSFGSAAFRFSLFLFLFRVCAMKRLSRSEFLGFGAVLAGAGTAAPPGLDLFAQGPLRFRPADAGRGPHRRERPRLYRGCRAAAGGSVGGEGRPLRRRRILAPTSGTSPPPAHASIDAAGQTVTPGFIDTHCHVSGVGELYSVNANVRRVRELQANLKAKADKTPPASGSKASCSTTRSSMSS